MGWGNRPVFTPAHQVERESGSLPLGPTIEAKRSRPLLGWVFITLFSKKECQCGNGGRLRGINASVLLQRSGCDEILVPFSADAI